MNTVPLRINLTNMERVRERDQNETWTRNETATERIWNGGRTDMEQTSSL